MNIVVNLYKEPGMSSHDAVTAVKKIFKARKAGHAGTLDPLATGVLLICLNEATKISGFILGLDKEYAITAKLGETTDTYDAEGAVTRCPNARAVSREEIEAVLQRFKGEIEQIPPMHSAIKVSGKPLYKLARQGIEVERKPRKIIIHSLEILKYEFPKVVLKVSCSKGTYMRSLCNDIGEALGVGAYMTELIRTKSGDIDIDNAARLDELPHKTTALCTIDTALHYLPEIILDGNDLKRAKNGNPIAFTSYDELNIPTSQFIRLKDHAGRLFGIGKVGKDSIKIERLLNL